jgi:phosphomannomutase
MTNITPSIFKAYDIRGLYPDELNEETAYRVGRGFAKLIQAETKKQDISVGVSNDMRLSSPQLKGKLIQGLLDSGCIVYDLGFCSTPTFYFGIGYHHYDGGIQVSASHNPGDYNGFKMVRRDAVPISETSGIIQIRDWAIENNWEPASTKGIYRNAENTTQIAIDSLTKNLPLNDIKPMTIVIDAANAMAIPDLDYYFSKLPQIKLIKLNFELNGQFPAHEADPLKDENLEFAEAAVKEHQADLGLVPDGDGDRYFFIDDQGNNIRQEIIRGIMAQIAIKENPGSTVCYDIRPGRITKDMIEEAGGKGSVTRVGHSLIKEQMLAENAPFGGESSGHYFYKTEWGTFETPALLLTKFLLYLSQQNQPLSAIVKPLKKYYNSGEINSTVSDAKSIINTIKSKYHDGELNELDGITITYEDYWFNVRASNTEPKLRLTLEAKTPELMSAKRDEVLALIRS